MRRKDCLGERFAVLRPKSELQLSSSGQIAAGVASRGRRLTVRERSRSAERQRLRGPPRCFCVTGACLIEPTGSDIIA